MKTKSCSEEKEQRILDLEWIWRDSLPRLTPKELLEIYPEAKKFLPEKLKEQEMICEAEEEYVVELLKNIEKNETDEFSKWFLERIVYYFGTRTLWTEKERLHKIRRLYASAYPPKPTPGALTDEMIERAREKSPSEIAMQYIPLTRISPERYKGKCPFHDDSTASFIIYEEKGNFYCFGCHRYFDTISFLMEIEGINFKEAVKRLQ